MDKHYDLRNNIPNSSNSNDNKNINDDENEKDKNETLAQFLS